ncbi:MAG: efflux RND transporter permease subunit, partial [Planctomycetota bacterium]|nr:efflux RND transporter permease subunit [Planctomycetota bacterium]
MIDSVIGFSIRRRGLVIALGMALAVWGLFAVAHTPIDAVPDLSENQVIVFTEWPGHGSREIEDQVTSHLCRQLNGLAGLNSVRGSSDVGFSMIHLIFDDSISYSAARTRVIQRLTAFTGQLPAGVTPRVAPEAIPTGQIFWYTVEGPGYDLARLRAVQDAYVRPQLEGVEGVAEVASVGGHVLEYLVELDPRRLRERGVDAGDVAREIERSSVTTGGHVLVHGNAEFVVRTTGWPGMRDTDSEARRTAMLADLRQIPVPTADGHSVSLNDIAQIRLGTRPRRGILEKDGNEVAGGVVLIHHRENPLEVTRRLKSKIAAVSAGLPTGVRIVPCYDRTPLIEGAVQTVTGTLVEAIGTAVVCVLLVLLHLRASFAIAVTLPLAALLSFAGMWTLRRLGIADVQTNIMSLAGISISIGVLVDSSIVMVENSMHHLREKFGDSPVRGDIREYVLPACRQVGRPIVGSVLVMLLSFLPVFALGGIDGRMYRPLAVTKCLALAAVAVLAITLVPALCTVCLKGRMRRESDSGIVRGVIEVYRPVLEYLLDQPLILVWTLWVTLVVAVCAAGAKNLVPVLAALGVVATVWAARGRASRIAAPLLLVGVALLLERGITPLSTELRMPLDEGMLMDMPITVPRAFSIQSGDDLKARDMVLCRFPEVDMVVGKAGRAETAFDPAPLDMIETMIMFRPREFWPRRKIARSAACELVRFTRDRMETLALVEPVESSEARTSQIEVALAAALSRYDAQQREFCYHRNQGFLRGLALDVRRHVMDAAARELLRSGAIVTLPD